ncbi:MAG: autorepressor SdpR family transcription factor, partial [Planctomycetaceae bacterium]
SQGMATQSRGHGTQPGPVGETMNSIFQALSDPTRREIVRLLRQRDMTAGQIAGRFSLARSTLSAHFNVLKNAGLIVSERNGTSIVYSLNLSAIEEMLAVILEMFDVGQVEAASPQKAVGKQQETSG